MIDNSVVYIIQGMWISATINVKTKKYKRSERSRTPRDSTLFNVSKFVIIHDK